MLFASVTTRIEGREDDRLLTEYGFNGFPSLAILDDSGKALVKKIGRDLGAMQDAVGKCSGYLALKAKVESGAEHDRKEWLLAQMNLEQLTGAEARTRAKELGLSGAEAKDVDNGILSLELRDLMAKEDAEHGDQVYKWFKSGRRLNDDAPNDRQTFFKVQVVNGALKHQDAEAYGFGARVARTQHQEQIERIRQILPRIEPARKRFAENKDVLAQIDRDEKKFKEQLATLEKVIASMDAFEAKNQDK